MARSWSRQTSSSDLQTEWRQQVEIADWTTTQGSEADQQEITKKHWKNADSVKACSNKECRKKFTLIERKHHCRRCGLVFCSSCLQYLRKLNLLAHIDPNGKQYKVCESCFRSGRDEEGMSRNLTELFLRLKLHSEQLKNSQNNREARKWRSRLDFDKECQRLIEGFKSRIGTSEMKRTFHEMTTIVSTPDWQKSSTWLQENLAETCQFCAVKLGTLLNKKMNCKVCGRVVCKQCSTKDLLLYIPNDVADSNVQPKLAIIKIIGCPEKEPEIAMYLRVCSVCQDRLVKKQVSAIEEEDYLERGDNLVQLINCHQKCVDISRKLDTQLAEYQIVIESLEDNSSRGDKSGKSNIKVLAKSQVDVADFLSQFVSKIQILKQIKPETNTQAVLFKNCLKSKCEYYQDMMFTYRMLTRRLGESTPPEILSVIQQTVDKNAIISAELYIRQLIFESLHICDKHKLKVDIPQLLSSVDEYIENEAMLCIKADGEDWERHEDCVKEMVREQMKGHRLIRLSRRQLQLHGSMHAEDLLLKRTVESLKQIIVQLDIKSINRSFKQSKTALKDAVSNLEQSPQK
ncbi:hypothetical protein FSP39_022549 [Pinctada imbricata]|uniref:FYVE-type domain-containing protein n=1 Tax=Pinctada imbricata TaxID=66713 RepID=A0AA88Y0J3_PINIB|nr:hypothetical protein FSP39_022549 [Pinctada imbricata]